MKLQIKSKKLGKTVTFSQPGNYYIYADLNGQPGTLGNQLTTQGSTLGCDEGDEDAFNKICRNWYRNYIKGFDAE